MLTPAIDALAISGSTKVVDSAAVVAPTASKRLMVLPQLPPAAPPPALDVPAKDDESPDRSMILHSQVQAVLGR